VCENASLPITLTGRDPDEGNCGPIIQGFAIASGPAHGSLSGTPPQMTYTPTPGYSGPDSFTFTATDGECVSDPATVAINVRPVNGGPTCLIVVGPLLQMTPDVMENIVVACDNQAAMVVLDGTLSLDPEGSALTYMWQVDGMPVGDQAIEAVMLDVGTHEITLTVNDGGPGAGECSGGSSSSTCYASVTVIDGCEAVEELVLLVEQSNIEAKLKRTLTKELKDSCKKFSKGKCKDGVKELVKFQDKVRQYDAFYKSPSKKAKSAKNQIDHETAEMLINAAQAIIDSYADCPCMEKK
jgi:hypothetical protein